MPIDSVAHLQNPWAELNIDAVFAQMLNSNNSNFRTLVTLDVFNLEDSSSAFCNVLVSLISIHPNIKVSEMIRFITRIFSPISSSQEVDIHAIGIRFRNMLRHILIGGNVYNESVKKYVRSWLVSNEG